MSILLLSTRMFWKRKAANIMLALQVVLSILALAPLFVYMADHYDNQEAVRQLPLHNAMVLTIHTYYSMEDVIAEIENSAPSVDTGRVHMYSATYNNRFYQVATYDKTLLNHYSPSLQSGIWFSNTSTIDKIKNIPAVISSDSGLSIGDIISIRLDTTASAATNELPINGAFSQPGVEVRVEIVGILKPPTQYLFPSGSASPQYFSAKSIISTYPAILLRDEDISDIKAHFLGVDERNVFLFTTDESVADETIVSNLARYGETTPMSSLVSYYFESTHVLIVSAAIIFSVFLTVAVVGILSNNVIQSLVNRRHFTVYYLLGMTWREAMVIEIIRMLLIILLSVLFTAIAGMFGLLMLEWMTPHRIALFFGTVFVYCLLIFATVGAGFLVQLMRGDMSVSLRHSE